ncbi:MAG: H4MPT-linked C1 transfer pathway protein [Planctomycetes bacterium]|nr:H4MPT-linked C1 transfer pathway protein [Planctomycetota bacterium]
MNWLGLDIGGANLKAADGRGWARSVPFPLWREPERLSAALAALIDSAPAADRVAITMTGELCDSFRTKVEGVRHILAAMQQAAAGRQVLVYLVDGRLVTVERAHEAPLLAAASNWHALARFSCRFIECNAGLLIDIGSTTTDIVPLIDGQPRPQGFHDTDRLLAGELVYTGVGRTPICAITNWLPWRGARCPVAAELFATAADAYVLLGELAEQPATKSIADGRPLVREFARERLARMICADATMFSLEDGQRAAAAVQDAQTSQIRSAIRQVTASMACQPECVVLSGMGEFLAKNLVREELPRIRPVSLGERLGPKISQSAPAHGLAVLALEAS